MKSALFSACVILCLASGLLETARADTRMRVKAVSTPIFNQAGGGGQPVGSANAGEILFVSRMDGDWAAVSPPDRITLWLNKDFIEDNRVLPNEIPVRSGPGIQHPVVGKLHRGDPVMPRGEQGEWCKIAPPSSCVLWARAGDLEEVQIRTSPIREVEPESRPAPEPEPAVASKPAAPAPVVTETAAVPPAAEPAASQPDEPPLRTAPVKVTPSRPQAETTEKPATPTAPKQTAPKTASKPKPKPAATLAQTASPTASPATLRPATALPTRTTAQSTPKQVVKKTRKTTPSATSATRTKSTAKPTTRKKTTVVEPIPTPAKTVKKAQAKPLEVEVDPALVEDLDLTDVPNQGNPVQVEGEIRNAPFLTASPSRYRLLDYSGSVPEMVCHIHGDSKVLRQYVGKGVSIRGREYWVESSDMPVVIVGELVPLEPSGDADEPVLF